MYNADITWPQRGTLNMFALYTEQLWSNMIMRLCWSFILCLNVVFTLLQLHLWPLTAPGGIFGTAAAGALLHCRMEKTWRIYDVWMCACRKQCLTLRLHVAVDRQGGAWRHDYVVNTRTTNTIMIQRCAVWWTERWKLSIWETDRQTDRQRERERERQGFTQSL